MFDPILEFFSFKKERVLLYKNYPLKQPPLSQEAINLSSSIETPMFTCNRSLDLEDGDVTDPNPLKSWLQFRKVKSLATSGHTLH